MSDRMDSFDMMDKVVDMSVVMDHDNEIQVDDNDAGNRVGIHIE
jgi:hypothetical protein